ncbi:hypothetical protein ETD85_32240 [Nonomuraea zeae]|uniref:Uncharacterized protein n=1 Tax=Nonomuraea zeae TaxID=1642303 RepID=A0A5S4G8X1_9ACTN|nr:hypothetical protein ETD85_32240 [Nonomuraea zeae]
MADAQPVRSTALPVVGEAVAGVRGGDVAVHEPSVEPLVAAMLAGPPLAHDAEIGLAQLTQEDFVMLAPEPCTERHETMVSACGLAGFAPRVTCRTREISTDVRHGRAVSDAGTGLGTNASRTGRRPRPLSGPSFTSTAPCGGPMTSLLYCAPLLGCAGDQR